MELRVGDPNGYQKLIFLRRESGKEQWKKPGGMLDPKIPENLPRNGWKVHDLEALKLWSHVNVPDVICEIGPQKNHDLEIIRMWLSLHPIYQRALYSGGLPFHAALIERNGRGVLLAGQGGAGKSTCCRRLPLSWHALCDDETLIVRDDHKRYSVHPFPTWSTHLRQSSEQTWNVQQHLPLAAIFFLEKSEKDEVMHLGQARAAANINQSAIQAYRGNWSNMDSEENRYFRIKLFENACELAKSIPAFRLRASLKGRFWKKMEKVL